MIEERVAVLESKLERNEDDITRLFGFLREHMEREEADRKSFLKLLAAVDGKLNSQKSFWGGMLFAFSGMAALIGSAIGWFKP